ncbi:MAG TPA: HNH endonuclease signature motif containing protein [Planctomycetota bacterium]|nr:HNH endonuclease signature motif containing protein [Planctomycetota bacterium]
MTPEEFIARAKRDLGWSPEAARLGIASGFCCTYCRQSLVEDLYSYDSWHRDHLKPQSSGGGDEEANLVLSCKVCNYIKGEYSPKGNSRQEQIEDASRYIAQGLRRKEDYFDKVKALVTAFLG